MLLEASTADFSLTLGKKPKGKRGRDALASHHEKKSSPLGKVGVKISLHFGKWGTRAHLFVVEKSAVK